MLENYQFADCPAKPIIKTPLWFRKMQDTMFEYLSLDRKRIWRQIIIDNVDFDELKKLFALHILNSLKHKFDPYQNLDIGKLLKQAIEMYGRTTTSHDFKKLSGLCFEKSKHIENNRLKQVVLTIHMTLSDYFGTAVKHIAQTDEEHAHRGQQIQIIHLFYEKFLDIFYNYAISLN